MAEKWRNIKGFKRYQVSTLGNVRRIDTKELVKPRKFGKFMYVSLRGGDRKRHKILVHQLVAKVLVPNGGKRSLVFHKNGVTTDNRPENLKWAGKPVVKGKKEAGKGEVVGTSLVDGSKVKFKSANSAARAGYGMVNKAISSGKKISEGYSWERL